MKRILRALVPRSLLKWLTDPEVEARVQARTAELAASVDLYRRLSEESTEGILIHQDGVIRFANRAVSRLVGGSSPAELLGRPVATLLAPEIREEVRARVEARLRGEPLPATIELEALRLDGSRGWIAATATVLEWGGAPAMRVAIIDITERHALLDEIQKARVEAEAARAAAEAASLAAQQASRAKSDFLAAMSHEIRTPMNGVLGMTSLLMDTELTPEQRQYAETVRLSGEALLVIINDILDFSKIEAGKLELDPAPFALRDMLGETLKRLSPLAHGKDVELVYDVSAGVPEDVVGDRGRLGQIVLNLVGNAIKFTERGEVAVLVGEEEATGDVVMLHLTVRDTGIGIPPEKQQLIFQAFDQADSSTTRRYGGSGLGLAISRRLAELMGGRMWVESEVGTGSTFHLVLPLARAAVPMTPPVTASRQSLQGLPVLVVDDNAINRQYLQGMLTSWGMKSAVAGSAATALAALEASRLRAEPCRLVLLDARMPDGDGFSVVERMRDDPSCADVSIILLASDLGGGDLRRCRELGISRHLVKPITPSELFDAVVEAVGAGSPSAPAAVTEVKPGSTRRRSLRVLVAEDNRVNQLVISRMLAQLSHTVVLCVDGQEAVAAVQDQRPDLVLMDVQMPVMDGFAATAAIRRREAEEPTRSRIPIVALTAFAVKGDRERCLAAGMDDYLSKPIQRDQLAAVLARWGDSGVLAPPEAAAEARRDPGPPPLKA